MADDLCRQSLHHLDRIRSHTITVMEILRHAEQHHIVFFLRPWHICPFVCCLPWERLHFLCITTVDFYLPGNGVQDSITAEKLSAHTFFHMHANLIELCPHERMITDRCKITSVHHIWNMMWRNTPPVCYSCCAVLIPAGITAIGIPLGMPDQNRYIRIINILIHQNPVAAFCAA